MGRLSCAKSLQSCPTLCNPMDCSLQGSSVQGILQARILRWVAISASKGSSQPRDQTCVSYGSCTAGELFTAEPPGKPSYGSTHILNRCGIQKHFTSSVVKTSLFSLPFSCLKVDLFWNISDSLSVVC